MKNNNISAHLVQEWMQDKNLAKVTEATMGSQYRAWWKCQNCNHQWIASVVCRVKGGGCPKCVGKINAPLIGANKLFLDEWIHKKNDKDIRDVTTGSGYKAWWQCKDCTHQWVASVAERVRGNGCPSCSLVKKRKRRILSVEAPHLVDEWAHEKNDKDISEITAGSAYKAWWNCKKCDHQWKAVVFGRVKGVLSRNVPNVS